MLTYFKLFRAILVNKLLRIQTNWLRVQILYYRLKQVYIKWQIENKAIEGMK